MQHALETRQIPRRSRLFAILLLAATVSACGGGGGTPSFTLTATAAGGGSVSPPTATIKRGATASFSLSPATGYRVGSVTGCGGSLNGNTYVTGPISGACTISAAFVLQVYTVTTSAGPGGSIGPASAQVEHGSTTTFTLNPLEGYSITGATGCGGTLNGNVYTTGPITGACSVSASFTINRYVVSASAGPGGSISPASAEVEHGSTTAFTLSALENYEIAGVTGCGGALNGNVYTTGAITGTCSVSASFALKRYEVTTSAGPGGSIDPASALVAHGSSTTFALVPQDGYSIADAAGCGGALDGNAYTTGPITAACTVSGSFVINRYEVTASAGPGGSIRPESVEVEHGSTASFEVEAEAGYRIDSVSGCGGTLEDAQFLTGPIIGACTIEALFRLPSVSGTVLPAAGTGADSDVNDPGAPFASNSTLQQAQFIGNPVTLGGYVNRRFQGPEGRSFSSGDEFDVFQVSLPAGQEVRLLIASEDVADDLDLWLVDLEGFLIDISIDPRARVESVVVPPDAAGEYYLVVRAWSGASNYLLVVDAPAPETPATMRLSDNFIAGEVIIRLVDDASVGDGEWLAQAGALGSARGRDPGEQQRSKLVSIDELHSLSARVAAVAGAPDADQLLAEAGGWLQVREPSMLAKLETLAMVKALSRDPTVAVVTPNYLHELHAEFIPDDPEFVKQWHYAQISAPEAWTLATGTGVIVAVIDSGVLLAHPDMAGRLVEGYDFVLRTPGGDDPGYNPVPPGGSTFHGTHVAGTIAAATDNGIGVAGVAFDARIMSLRVCNVNGCSGYAIEQALRYAAGLSNDSGVIPPQPAQVVNLSLGRQGGPALTQEQLLYNQLRELDIFVVASAGNSSTSTVAYPAAYSNVIAVSALDFAGNRAFYSNFGTWIDVAAPGGDLGRDLNGDGFPDGVLSTSADDRDGPPQPNYRFLQGTSMAAPHVAGVAALMRAAVPELRAQDIEHLLRNRVITDDLGPPGRDDVYGWGLINAVKAVTEALNAGGEPVPLAPFMAASSEAVNFGFTLQGRQVVFSNIGGGELTFGVPMEDSGGWLSLVPEEIEGELLLSLLTDRSGLEEGRYFATVTMPSNANTLEVTVIMQIATLPGAKVGLQYVLLVDPDSMQALHWAIAEPAGDGRQPFRIDSVPPGSYLLVSGSDSDNDAFICDAGESCGFYREGTDIALIEVLDEDLDGLEFESGYSVPGIAPGSIPASGSGIFIGRE